MIQTASIAAMIGDLCTASLRCAAVILMFASSAEEQWVTVRYRGCSDGRKTGSSTEQRRPHTPLTASLTSPVCGTPAASASPAVRNRRIASNTVSGRSLEGGSDVLLRGLNIAYITRIIS